MNDTELMPALSEAHSEVEASGGGDGTFSTIFDSKAQEEVAAVGAQQTGADRLVGDAAREQQQQQPEQSPGGDVAAGDKAALEGGEPAQPAAAPGGGNAAVPTAHGGAGLRGGGNAHARAPGGPPGSQVWHRMYTMWRG